MELSSKYSKTLRSLITTGALQVSYIIHTTQSPHHWLNKEQAYSNFQLHLKIIKRISK